jgi:hypothetical protein
VDIAEGDKVNVLYCIELFIFHKSSIRCGNSQQYTEYTYRICYNMSNNIQDTMRKHVQ